VHKKDPNLFLSIMKPSVL